MGDIGPGHVATHQDGIWVVRTDSWMEHCPATTGANNLEITWTGVATVGQHQRGGHDKSKEEKDHLFLFFAFVTICFPFFLAESSVFVNLSEALLDLHLQELGCILIVDFLEYSVG